MSITRWKCALPLLMCLFLYHCKAAGVPAENPASANATTGDIRTIKLYKTGDQTSFPVLGLNSSDQLELHFDDMDGGVKNYYYSFQLCNADWTPSMLNTFEYIKGFQSVRITNYRNSSIATARYTHYQATVPERNSYPIRSGNYLLRVFMNNDTTRTVFTRRFVVVDTKAALSPQLQQPFNSQWFRTHQKIQMIIQTDSRIQILSPQDLKVVVLQNNNWQTALYMDRPTIYRGNYFEYNDEAITSIPAGKEWRWIDLRSFRLLSDRMERMDKNADTPFIYVKQDISRAGQAFVYYRDLNGSFTVETLEGVNPFWQGDYGNVQFTYAPSNGRPFEGRDVFVFGEFTDFANKGKGKMTFNESKGVYETTLYMKQGYYNYNYMTLPTGKPGFPDFSQTEGNFWGTENAYTVLVYYRPFGARADEIIGFASLNSAFQRNGF
ncbi:MAG TPA: DUF5103 domain-containing protein [Flavisolibacter sp.]|nr:DUF5103 domain-containing protein [Flavisolibacter sp.]